MAIGVMVEGKYNSKKSKKEDIIKQICDRFYAQEDPILNRLAKVFHNESGVRAFLHPAEAPVEIIFDGDKVFCSGKTNSAGPGYHQYLTQLILDIGEKNNIQWNWEKDYYNFDDSNEEGKYNYKRLQYEMLGWLKGVADKVTGADGHKYYKISFPAEYDLDMEFFALNSLGFWEKEWFTIYKNLPNERVEIIGKDFFPWWEKGLDASFYLNTAKVIMWVYCPWHKPTNEGEAKLYSLILECLDKAYSMDETLDYPWNEWIEIFELVNLPEKANEIRNLAKNKKESKTPIGFKKNVVEWDVNGGWLVKLPGYYYVQLEDEGASVVFWYEKKSLKVTTLNVEKEGGKAEPEEVLKNFWEKENPEQFMEVIEHSEDNIVGRAGLLLHKENENVEFYVLRGYCAIENGMSVFTFCFDDIKDKEWAIDCWKNIEYHLPEDPAE